MLTTFYEISIVLTTVLLLGALGWSVSLRRRIREQTELIRDQLKRESELKADYRELFEHANDFVYRHDLTGRFTSINQAAEQILGFARDKALGVPFRDSVIPDQRAGFDQWLGACVAGHAPVRTELTLASPDGQCSVVEFSTRLIRKDGLPIGIEGIGRDVTARRRAEEELRQSEERFSSAFRASPIPIAISTVAEGRILDVNASFLRMFGFEKAEIIDSTSHDLGLWTDASEEAKVMETLGEQKSIDGMECRFRTKSGNTRIGLVFVEPIELGRMPCALIITHDVTERLALEAQLRQALKMEAVGRLAAGVAHDFNNLLTVIQGHASLVMCRKDLPSQLTKSIEAVSDASHRAAKLTRQLLTFSRQGEMESLPCELNELINDTAKMLKHLVPPSVSVQYNFAANLPIINADLTMMQQVLMNLVVNARDAMPEGGTLKISTKAVQIDPEFVRNHPQARICSTVCLTVQDTGCGMSAATQARIFEPFFTTKPTGKGTGLGLATVYGIVQQHQGWITLCSEEGKGTQFKVFFPSETAVAAPVTKPVVDGQPRIPTILVVEDEPQVSELVGELLRSSGYRIFEASSGLAALQIWNEQGGGIDLVLADMVMDKGMSGPELAKNLRALKADLKVVYTSGYSREVAGFDLELHEGVNFLPKPHTPGGLLEIVQRQLPPPALEKQAA